MLRLFLFSQNYSIFAVDFAIKPIDKGAQIAKN